MNSYYREKRNFFTIDQTGNEWSADMKSRMIGILESLDFVDLFRTDEKVRVNDDRSVLFSGM